MFAGFVAAEAGDPNLAVADHGTLGVDEEIFVFLFEDCVFYVVREDTVVVFYELFLIFDGKGLFAGIDLDGVVDEGGYCGGVMFRDGLLELGEDCMDLGVVAYGEVNGFVEVGEGGLGEAGSSHEGKGGDECEVGADGHSVSIEVYLALVG